MPPSQNQPKRADDDERNGRHDRPGRRAGTRDEPQCGSDEPDTGLHEKPDGESREQTARSVALHARRCQPVLVASPDSAIRAGNCTCRQVLDLNGIPFDTADPAPNEGRRTGEIWHRWMGRVDARGVKAQTRARAESMK
jgi:hypothetical protein